MMADAGFYLWETTDISIKLSGDGNPLEGWERIVVSIAQNGRPVLELFDEDLGIDVSESRINVHLTQEQTGSFREGDAVVQVNVYYSDSERDVSVKGHLTVLDNLHKKVMP